MGHPMVSPEAAKIDLCEHITSHKYSLLWWESCPECYDGAYIVHRCIGCKKEYKQGELQFHTKCGQKDQLEIFVERCKTLSDKNGRVEGWKLIKTSAMYTKLELEYEKSDLFKLFNKVTE